MTPEQLKVLAQKQEREKDFQLRVLALARLLGWKAAHFRPGLTRKGQWRTAVQGDGKGFPDLILVHPKKKRVLFVELKRQTGKPSPEQQAWLDLLRQASQEVYLWRPCDWDTIRQILER